MVTSSSVERIEVSGLLLDVTISVLPNVVVTTKPELPPDVVPSSGVEGLGLSKEAVSMAASEDVVSIEASVLVDSFSGDDGGTFS